MEILLLKSLEDASNNNHLIYIAVIAAIVVLLAVLFLIKANKKPKIKQIYKVKVDDVLIKNLANCFQKEEIVSIESELSRLKIEVKDLKSVDLEELKKLSNGLFITGNVIKVMVKDSADEVMIGLKNYYNI